MKNFILGCLLSFGLMFGIGCVNARSEKPKEENLNMTLIGTCPPSTGVYRLVDPIDNSVRYVMVSGAFSANISK